MLCPKCERAFADLPDMRNLKDKTTSPESRRSSAIRLLAKARRRNKKPAFSLL